MWGMFVLKDNYEIAVLSINLSPLVTVKELITLGLTQQSRL
jgi:hypothetical protein